MDEVQTHCSDYNAVVAGGDHLVNPKRVDAQDTRLTTRTESRARGSGSVGATGQGRKEADAEPCTQEARCDSDEATCFNCPAGVARTGSNGIPRASNNIWVRDPVSGSNSKSRTCAPPDRPRSACVVCRGVDRRVGNNRHAKPVVAPAYAS